MKIITCNAKYSSIVKIGDKVKQLSKETGNEYLLLNRGINSVCPLELDEVIRKIDFNSTPIQVYPPAKGFPALREAVNTEYFQNKSNPENIHITGGGMNGLDLTVQVLDVEKIFLPAYYWGSYSHILNIRNTGSEFYDSFGELIGNSDLSEKNAVIICDPNNPVGNKYDDTIVLNTVRQLGEKNVTVIIDCPYRRVFMDSSDDFYVQLLKFPNVIIVDSFSKSLGLSGQRIGFVHSVNESFNYEIGLRLMYSTNGINAFSQILIEKLLSTSEGKRAVTDFKTKTTVDIQKNINLLKEKNLLAKEFYTESEPKGIFVVVNKSEEQLLEKRIAAISLAYFTKKYKETASAYSRICVSVPHPDFARFFNEAF